jgi:soluble lytic murein transglycosylase
MSAQMEPLNMVASPSWLAGYRKLTLYSHISPSDKVEQGWAAGRGGITEMVTIASDSRNMPAFSGFSIGVRMVARGILSVALAAAVLLAAVPAGAQGLSPSERKALEKSATKKPPAPKAKAATRAQARKDAKVKHEAQRPRPAPVHNPSSLTSSRDPIAAKINNWLSLTRANSGAGFETIARFIEDNPAWPRQGVLQRRAEDAIDARVPPEQVITWFTDHEPVTGNGRRLLGEAYLALGDRVRGVAQIRRAWVEGDFSPAEEDRFELAHQSLLTPQDHIARLDRLLWDGQDQAAERMQRLVDPGHRALMHARIQLHRQAASADSVADRVPANLRNDPGLLYERMRWYRRRDDDASAVEILKHAPADLVRPDLWWNERQVIARRLISRGQARDAYAIVRNHGLPLSGDRADAEWLAGWIALRFAGDPKTAMGHFERAHDSAETPGGRARAAYWAGRGAEALGDQNRALGWYREAAQYHTNYYGQLAAGHDRDGSRRLDMREPVPTAAETQTFNSLDLVHAVKLLHDLREEALLRIFYISLAEASTNPSHYVLTARLALAQGRPDLAVMVARRAIRNGYALPESGFPVIPAPEGSPERAMVLSVARQESNFRMDAVSPAGALGLMQLMPGTAKSMAKLVGVPYVQTRLTSDWQYNVSLGRAYLAHMLDMFSGSRILAFAAYNAGPGNVSKWIRMFGDPRSDQVDKIDWIELIPYNETRNYVQRVFENHSVYQRRLGRPQVASTLFEDPTR